MKMPTQVIRAAVVMALLASPVAAKDKTSIVADFKAMHAACLAYLQGDTKAIPALSRHGFDVTQRGKKLIAIKRGPMGIPANRRPEAALTVGKRIPMNAETTCQLSASRIDISEARLLNVFGILQVEGLGFKPRGGNGIMMEKYDRGAETWLVNGSYTEEMGILTQVVSKMK